MAERPGKTQTLTFPKRPKVEEVARIVVSEQVLALQKAIKRARGSRDPEDLHHLRVSVRKLRVGLRTFKRQLDPDMVRALTDDLRWLFQRLGAVREYDVLLRDLALDEDLTDDAELASLRTELLRRRDVTVRAASRAMASPRYGRLRRALHALPAALEEVREGGDKPAKKWARKRLERHHARVRALRDAFSSGDAQQLHELRKELKKLRYAAGLLAPLWPRKRVKAYLAPLEELQDLLGTLNDTAVAERLLGAAAKRVAATVPVAERRVSMLSAATEPVRERARRRARRFIDTKPFWS